MHGISVLIASVSSEGSGESAHMRRFARAFAADILKVWMLMTAQTKVLSSSFHVRIQSFVRGGQTSATFFVCLLDEGREAPNSTKTGHLNGVSLAGRLLPNIEWWLGSFWDPDQYC